MGGSNICAALAMHHTVSPSEHTTFGAVPPAFTSIWYLANIHDALALNVGRRHMSVLAVKCWAAAEQHACILYVLKSVHKASRFD
jgi:hypothetical protein